MKYMYLYCVLNIMSNQISPHLQWKYLSLKYCTYIVLLYPLPDCCRLSIKIHKFPFHKNWPHNENYLVWWKFIFNFIPVLFWSDVFLQCESFCWKIYAFVFTLVKYSKFVLFCIIKLCRNLAKDSSIKDVQEVKKFKPWTNWLIDVWTREEEGGLQSQIFLSENSQKRIIKLLKFERRNFQVQ